jgi:PAS domain S-box-containing protein
MMGGYFGQDYAFITYFFAVAAATLLGGFWPGILAIVLSALAALYFFMSPLFGFDFNTANAVALAVFITFSGLLVLLVRALNVVVERSLALEETLQTEIERSQRAERDSRHLAAIVEYSDDAILTKDLNGRITSWNRGAERLFGYSADEVVGKPITILIPPERHDEEPGILERVRQGDRVNHYDTVRRRKDGSLIDISLTVSPIKSSDGTISGASSIARDVTERTRLQERQQLIVREMKHRIKNSLATVQAIATQTLKNADDRDAFIGRLHALFRAHDVLTSEAWERTRLSAAVSGALEPFQEQAGSRVRMNGDQHLWLDPVKTVMVAMILHELGTNAVKYGALSNSTGCVDVTWQRFSNPDVVKLLWEESGGPPIKLPKSKGFGSHLIERAFGGQLGHARLEFNPPGLSCTLEIAL